MTTTHVPRELALPSCLVSELSCTHHTHTHCLSSHAAHAPLTSSTHSTNLKKSGSAKSGYDATLEREIRDNGSPSVCLWPHKGIEKREKRGKEKKEKATPPIVRMWSPTILLSLAQRCLTSVIGRELVLPSWYERSRERRKILTLSTLHSDQICHSYPLSLFSLLFIAFWNFTQLQTS